jgi:ATP-dependent RNA helicase RhlE
MDRMLDLGFIHQIEHIMEHLPKERQSLMLSATFPKRVLKLAQEYLTNPKEVVIDGLNSVSANIEQKIINTEGAKKPKELNDLLKQLKGQVIIFTKTQKAADLIRNQLVKAGRAAASLHGGHKQKNREKTVAAFKAREMDILVATDVAARGLDIPKISYVINYELPQSPQEYIHRIGRTGRVKEKGVAISLIGKSDRQKWKEIQAFLKGDEKAPTPQELEKQRAILQVNREKGPFPVKEESKLFFKQHAANAKQREPKTVREAPGKEIKKALTQPSAAPEFVNKDNRQNKASAHECKKQKQTPAKPDKKEGAFPQFKLVYVGKKKKERKKEFKKYGKGPAKYWAKVMTNKKILRSKKRRK